MMRAFRDGNPGLVKSGRGYIDKEWADDRSIKWTC
jgi:hypothetical protein